MLEQKYMPLLLAAEIIFQHDTSVRRKLRVRGNPVWISMDKAQYGPTCLN